MARRIRALEQTRINKASKAGGASSDASLDAPAELRAALGDRHYRLHTAEHKLRSAFDELKAARLDELAETLATVSISVVTTRLLQPKNPKGESLKNMCSQLTDVLSWQYTRDRITSWYRFRVREAQADERRQRVEAEILRGKKEAEAAEASADAARSKNLSIADGNSATTAAKTRSHCSPLTAAYADPASCAVARTTRNPSSRRLWRAHAAPNVS